MNKAELITFNTINEYIVGDDELSKILDMASIYLADKYKNILSREDNKHSSDRRMLNLLGFDLIVKHTDSPVMFFIDVTTGNKNTTRGKLRRFKSDAYTRLFEVCGAVGVVLNVKGSNIPKTLAAFLCSEYFQRSSPRVMYVTVQEDGICLVK